ncbi:MAG: DUF2911 domain-containing protein [Bacteroidota bacterium]|nr:DUF2911 domain-containing protein [Bacteroidota bacterium]
MILPRFATALLVSTLLLTACSSESGWSPSPDEPRAFVTTLGSDTLSVEVYTRDSERITGILADRVPYTHVIEYDVALNDLGNMASLDMTMTTPDTNPDGPEPTSVRVAVDGSTATVTREGGSNEGTSEVSVPDGVLLTLGRAASAAFVFEQVAMQLRADQPIHLLGATSAAARQNDAGIIDADTVFMDYFGKQRKAWTDKQDQLLGITGKGTTNKSETRRVEPMLIGSMADRWAAMDVSGAGMGTPSPAATTLATVDGADLEVRYSQPAKRGRDIWGGLVPNGTIWRTGANAATHFTTSRDLVIGGETLAAGTYTLWSLYEDGAFSLIVNEQTDQWGTAHDAAFDLFSVPMSSQTLDAVQERFVIGVEDTAEGGVLTLTWDQTVWSVAFTVQ